MKVEAASYLDHFLEPFQALLAQRDVTDIYVNQPGEAWVERLGGEIEQLDHPALDEVLLWGLARQVASHSHQGVSRRHPLLAASLPDGSRIQIVAPPATRQHLALAIRRHAAARVPLDSYQPAAEQGDGDAARAELNALLDAKAYPAFLAGAVRARLNIVISGGTSSGKTTLLNSLLEEIPAHERLILIEDTPELRLRHANSVGLLAVHGHEGEAQVTPEALLQVALRMRPDRILMGELRGPEAFAFLRAINTGHPGSLTTIHADSPERALTQLALMVTRSEAGVRYTDARQLVSDMVDIVVQIERRDGARRITSVLMGKQLA